MGDQRNISQTFAEHRITLVQPSKSWRVQKPGTWIYGFTVTWSPGVIAIAGDVDELIAWHPHALSTFESAMKWLDRIDFDYFMTKTGEKRVYSREASIKLIVEHANADAERDDNAPFWCRLFEEFGHHVNHGAENPLNAEHRKALAAALADDPDLDGHAIYNATNDPEFIVSTWTIRHRHQFEAIMAWHRLMKTRWAPTGAVVRAFRRLLSQLRKVLRWK